MQQSVSPPRGSRWIWAPLALVLVLAAAWSVFWFYAAQRAEADLDAFIAREAQAGRVLRCAGREIGGYPFRIEVRCAEPTAEFAAGDGVSATARELLAVAQIYSPGLVIAELTGPLTITRPGAPGPLTLDWTLLQASVRTRDGQPERVSVVLETPRLAAGPADNPQPLGQAKHAELHARLSAGSEASRPVVELAASAQEAVVAIPGFSPQPMNGEGTAVVRGLRDLAPKPWDVRLREWQEVGGRLEITRLRVQRGETVAVAAGELGLTPQGRLDGALAVTATGIEPVVELLLGPAEARTRSAILAGLQLIGGRAELEGKRAIALPLRLRDGVATLGPVPVGQVPPVF